MIDLRYEYSEVRLPEDSPVKLPLPPMDLVMDDLWCWSVGKRVSMPPNELVKVALQWLIVLMHMPESKHAHEIAKTYWPR